jgi:hypothetical protein
MTSVSGMSMAGGGSETARRIGGVRSGPDENHCFASVEANQEGLVPEIKPLFGEHRTGPGGVLHPGHLPDAHFPGPFGVCCENTQAAAFPKRNQLVLRPDERASAVEFRGFSPGASLAWPALGQPSIRSQRRRPSDQSTQRKRPSGSLRPLNPKRWPRSRTGRLQCISSCVPRQTSTKPLPSGWTLRSTDPLRKYAEETSTQSPSTTGDMAFTEESWRARNQKAKRFSTGGWIE